MEEKEDEAREAQKEIFEAEGYHVISRKLRLPADFVPCGYKRPAIFIAQSWSDRSTTKRPTKPLLLYTSFRVMVIMVGPELRPRQKPKPTWAVGIENFRSTMKTVWGSSPKRSKPPIRAIPRRVLGTKRPIRSTRNVVAKKTR